MADLVLVDKNELRERIGGATDLSSVPGRVLDESLQALIDEEAEALKAAALSRARELGLQGMSGMPLGEPVTVTLTVAGEDSRLARGTLDKDYFPFVFRAAADTGKGLDYDPRIGLTASFEPIPGIFHRFDIRGKEVYCLPRTLEAVTLWMATDEDVVTHIMADQIPVVNERLELRGRRMLEALIVEQTRLEGRDQGLQED